MYFLSQEKGCAHNIVCAPEILTSIYFFFVISWSFCDIAFIWDDFLCLSKFQQHPMNQRKSELFQ